ncbi:MAG: GH116 family glycosyl hydrolase, partial [bacterium]
GMPRGAYGMELSLAPGESAQVTFLLTWYFPNFTELDYRGKPGQIIGVQYANKFSSAASVAAFLLKEKARLEGGTRVFADAFYASSLPEWELQAVMAGLSALWRAAWWDKSGRFGVWEGLGCCGIQTIDVGHYASFPILQFFPELDAAQNRLTAANLEPSGKVPHNMPGNFSCCDTHDGRGRIDLGAQYVLALWRYARWTGDLKEAEKLWPVIVNNIAWLEGTDNDGDGLPNNIGPDQTYDRFPLFGTSSYVGFLYLGCLRAAAELAGWLGQSAKVIEYRQKADRASATLQEQLWNGEYYNLSYDASSDSANTGCMTDQLNGDWFYRQSSGDGLLPDHRVRSALLAMVKYNRRSAGHHSWLPNCTWPQGGGIEITRRGSDQANCPWSGVEYSVAAHLAMLGERGVGREVAQAVFARYDDAGMRFNHIECGGYYYRAMSSWALYLAEYGISYDARAQQLSLNPPAGDADFIITLPGSVTRCTIVENELKLQVISGKLHLHSLQLRGKQISDAVKLNAGGVTVVGI